MASAEWTLAPHATIPRGLPVLVCILDGWGENAVNDEYNACHAASTPNVDALRAKGAAHWRTVRAHGPAVGLPTWDDMGNSEVGHNALGAGQLIDQGARLVDKALSDGSLFKQAGWQYISSAFKDHTVHFIGLLSSGGVHSRANQLYQRACPRRRRARPPARVSAAAGSCCCCGAEAREGAAAARRRLSGMPQCGGRLTCAGAPFPPRAAVLKGCADSGVKRVRVHILLDGRDVPDGSSVADTTELQKARSHARRLRAAPARSRRPRRRRAGCLPCAARCEAHAARRRSLHSFGSRFALFGCTLLQASRAAARHRQVLTELGAAGCDARIASGGGRMYITMDRCAARRVPAPCCVHSTDTPALCRSYEADWSMVQRGWAAHVLGRAEHSYTECVRAPALRSTRAQPRSRRAARPWCSAQPHRGHQRAAQGSL